MMDTDTTHNTTTNDRKTEYRDLLDLIENLNDNDNIYADPSIINETLLRVNILFKGATIKQKVKHTDEVLLDAKVIATASDVLLKVTNAIDCAIDAYDPADFARRIRTKLINDEADEDSDAYYANLVESMQGLYKKAPNYYSFFGPIGNTSAKPPPEKVRKERKEKRKVEQAQKKAPERITHADKEEDSVDDTVKFLQWSLTKEYEERNNEPISFYHFLIDPNSFSNSIENMFHISFLIRDGRVKIDTDDDRNLFLSPLSSQEKKRAKKGAIDYKQYMFSFDLKQWNVIKNDKKINTYFLETRKKDWEQLKQKI